MRGYLKRLVHDGRGLPVRRTSSPRRIALVTLPLYTRHVSAAGYGADNSLLTAVILSSIFLRVGVGEAFVRFYFDDEDSRAGTGSRARRRRRSRGRRRWRRCWRWCSPGRCRG